MDAKMKAKIEILEAWSDALDYVIDSHMEYAYEKNLLRRQKLMRIYDKARRVADRLAKQL